MRLQSVHLKNYRSCLDTNVVLADYSCFVGPNGAGKSSILSALNTLFRDASNPTSVSTLSEEDFHLRRTEEPIEISATFTDLSDAARADLIEYVRQGELTITARAEWDPGRRCADVQQFGSRMVMLQFAPFFKAEGDGAKVGELVPIYDGLREAVPELPAIKTKVGMVAALRAHEEAHPELCEPLESSDQFYGWSKGSNRLARHVQWVYIPAVKHASEEEVEGRTTALGQLLQRTIRGKVDFSGPLGELREELEAKYQAVIADRRDTLGELSKSIQRRVREWSHPGVNVAVDWSYDPDRSLVVQEPTARVALGEGGFQGELARLGHGLQRSFIVALLTELAATEFEGQPTLILGFEEPELYQHPPQARHLASVLESLAAGQAQVLIATHSPYFVSGHGFESVRMTSKDPATGASKVAALTHQELAERLAAAMGEEPAPATEMMARVEQVMQPSQNELFFSRLPILVEGTEDVAFVTTQLHLRGDWSEFRRCGGHFVVCGGKTNMSRPLAIAEGLGVAALAIFDGDFCEGDKHEAQHRRDNGCLLNLAGYPNEDTWTSATVWRERLVMFGCSMVKAVQEEVGVDKWSEVKQRAKARMGIEGALSPKNGMWIAASLEELHDEGISVGVLDKLCESILAFGNKVQAGAGGQA
jgi:putative ATP-dependent endonuclease of the OLD family